MWNIFPAYSNSQQPLVFQKLAAFEMDWMSLPAELRAMVLQALICEGDIATHASVSREWQKAIEIYNFQSLELKAKDISMFGALAKRNFHLIKYIWYSIELPEYDCSECSQLENQDLMDANQATVENSIRLLFGALSTIVPGPEADMTLDISIHSPSDSQHHFKYIRTEPAKPLSSRRYRALAPYSDLSHNSPASSLSLDIIDRIFLDISFPEPQDEFWNSVPEAPCVTHLLLRRQTRRRWDATSLSRLFNRLPRLRRVHYEPWREWVRMLQHSADKRSGDLFNFLTSHTNIERMTIFEDLNETYISTFSTGLHEALDAEPVRQAIPYVARNLAKASLRLQHLSAAFITDVDLFWNECLSHTDWMWGQLQTLSLTSRILMPTNKSEDINRVLLSSAQAIRQMPQLLKLELWNGGKGYAAMFRFQSVRANVNRRASIAWRGTWGLILESSVITAWEDTRTSHAGHLDIQNEILEPREIRSHGEAVLSLELEIDVACPILIQQIHEEHIFPGP